MKILVMVVAIALAIGNFAKAGEAPVERIKVSDEVARLSGDLSDLANEMCAGQLIEFGCHEQNFVAIRLLQKLESYRLGVQTPAYSFETRIVYQETLREVNALWDRYVSFKQNRNESTFWQKRIKRDFDIYMNRRFK